MDGLPGDPQPARRRRAADRSVDRVAFYVPPAIGITLLSGIARKGGVSEVFLNPGSESDELVAEAERLRLPTIQACAIVDIGERP